MHLEIRKSTAYTFTWDFFEYDIQEVPSTGTITIYKKTGAELVSETSVSIDSVGQIAYTISATDTATVDINYKIQLKYRIGDLYYYKHYLFDIVECPIVNVVKDSDLFELVPELRNDITEVTMETTAAGSTSTLVCSKLANDERNYKGGRIEIFISDTIVHPAKITNHVSNTLTFSPAYSSAIGNSTVFKIRPSFQYIIDRAFNDYVWRDVRNKVPAASGYIDTDVLKNLTVYKALELYCVGSVEIADDKWDLRYNRFKEDYQAEYLKLKEPYDISEDGNISDKEDDNRPNYTSVSILR